MKKLLFAVTTGALLLTACSKDEELILGTWHATSILYNDTEVINSNASLTNVRTTFNADGTGTSESDASNDSFTYHMEGDILTAYVPGDTLEYTLVKLTVDELQANVMIGPAHVEYFYEK